VVAHRVGRLARETRQGAEGVTRRSQEALQRALTAPDGLLTTRADLADLTSELERLALAVERLEGRCLTVPGRAAG
jgi:ubiquinone biosynthesis protein UbiJ